MIRCCLLLAASWAGLGAPDDRPTGDASMAAAGSQAAALVALDPDPVEAMSASRANVGAAVAVHETGGGALPPAGADAESADAQGEHPAPVEGDAVLPPPTAKRQDSRPDGGRSDGVPWYRSGLMSLVVVLGLIGAVAVVVRRLVPSVRNMSSGAIEIIGRHTLAPKQSIALVRVGRRLLLVGITAEQINRLCEIDDAAEVSDLLGRIPGRERSDGTEDFEHLLDGSAADLRDSLEGLDRPIEPACGGSQHLHRAKGRLQGLLSRLKVMQER
ncbi:MAG: flagellar biosynthetic protein FliO [Planctomycetes bacterium]|nr:flagellar biosynthetic protein FliO [Planctomycetota bacterium]